jgi:hypothetical protein
MANKQPMIELNGDLDLFGDGSVYIHRPVSHTPGSQIALIRLPKTGLVVLTSDVRYLKALDVGRVRSPYLDRLRRARQDVSATSSRLPARRSVEAHHRHGLAVGRMFG